MKDDKTDISNIGRKEQLRSKMDEETIIILSIQLMALSCIAAALVVYLICKVNRRKHTYDSSSLNVGTGRSVLLTCSETVFGIQLALHLTSLGFRVFAGVKPKQESAVSYHQPSRDNNVLTAETITTTTNDGGNNGTDHDGIGNSESMKMLKAKLKQREALSTAFIGVDGDGGEEYVVRTSNFGSLITVPLDVTREDSLHEALDEVRRHLPAGEDGLWAVINTSGICYKGKLDQQESSKWDAMFKVNVFGMLRTARTFMPLLKNKKGRFLTIGTGNEYKLGPSGSVVYTAARHAVVGACTSLAREMSSYGVNVVTINMDSIPSDKLFVMPKIPAQDGTKSSMNDQYVKYDVTVLPEYALNIIEESLLVEPPKKEYVISKPTGFYNYMAVISNKLENAHKKKYKVNEQIINGV